MTLLLSKEHQVVQQLAKDFAQQELTNDILDLVEETGEFPEEIYKKMAECGFLGIKFPEKYGGSGFDHLAYVLVMEQIAKVSGVASIYVSSPNSLLGTPLMLSGSEDQKQKYLVPLIKGDIKMCFGLTEPGAGSDAGSMVSTAMKEGDYYILNGRKTFITGAPLSQAGVIYAKTERTTSAKGISAFIVDFDLPGVSFGKPENKMGMIGCATSDVIFDNVKVHKDALLGKEGRGFLNAMNTLDVGRIGVAAQGVGIASAALEETINYIKERKQFGRPIASFQGLRFILADMATKVETARLLLYEAAVAKDRGEDTSKIASMAKYYCTEICNEVCAKAIQLHGGYGYMKEYKVERLYRDARVLTIYEGTSQVQQMVIASQLLK